MERSVPSSGATPVVPPALAALCGTVLEGRYSLGKVLGAGGMGAVFEGRHLRLDRPVAIKVLQPVFVGHDEYIARFLREAKAASKVRHRNVVEIHDYGEASGGLVYSVMEYLVGRDLDQHMGQQAGGRLSWEYARGLLIQVATGLRAAHAQGVIHRDIKPANCFVTTEEGQPVVKLVDFGIAKIEGPNRGNTLTGTAQMLGTPSYIAPELVRTEGAASPRSDIYSLGVLAYRMLTGRAPFSGETVFELLRHACFDPVPSMRERAPGLPPVAEQFILTLLAKDPADRPHDMEAVLEGLRALPDEDLTMVASVPRELRASPPAEATVRHMTAPVGVAETIMPVAEADATVVRLPATVAQPTPSGLVLRPMSGVTPEPVSATVADPTSELPNDLAADLPSHSATAPLVGESTLSGLERSGPIARPPARSLWGYAAVAVVAAVVAVAAVLAWPRADPSDPSDQVSSASVAAAAGIDPAGSLAPGAESANPVSPPEAAAAPMGTPDQDAADAVEAAVPGSDAEPTPDPVAVEPAPRPTPARPKPKAKSKPSGPPSDSTVLKRLRKKIAARCAEHGDTSAVSVSFLVTSDGGIVGANASPAGAVGSCAKAIVQGTKFRPRADSTAKKLVMGR